MAFSDFLLAQVYYFCWVFPHAGIHGNEVADREVKIVAQSADITFNKCHPLILKGHLGHKF